MKLKKILIVSLILLAVLTIGAVSASSDMDMLSQDSTDDIPLANMTVIDDDITLDDNPSLDVNEHIDIDGNDYAVAFLDVPCDEGGAVEFSGVFSVNINDEDIYTRAITPNTVTADDLPAEIKLSDLDFFTGIEDGTFIDFRFWVNNDPDEMGSVSELRVLSDHRDDGYIELQPVRQNDFDVDFYEANVADHAIAIVIDPQQEALAKISRFVIGIDFWGDFIETEWDVADVTLDEFGNYCWDTTQLGIDEKMWDIMGFVDCEAIVHAIDEDEYWYSCNGDMVFVNSPYICASELSALVESEAAINFAFFPPADDLFVVSIRKDGAFFANRTFKISEMDQYMDEDDLYYLFLEDLGISELGEYEVSIIFTNLPGSAEKIYSNTFNVVPFVIREFKGPFEQITEPVFTIVLPEGSEGNAIIEVDGKQVFNKTLSDIGYTEFFRGPGYYIKLNDLDIMESGYHDVQLTVNAMGVTRTVGRYIFVNVTENTFEFLDGVYTLDNIMDVYLGTPISQDSEIALYLDGEKAAVGSIDFEGLYFDYDEAYTDIYGFLLPAQYQGRLEIGGVTVAEDTFKVADNSGDIEANIVEIGGEYYLNFKAPWPKTGELWEHGLNVYVDPEPYVPYGFVGEPVISYRGEELEELLDGSVHALYIGELEPGNHYIFVEYFTDIDEIPLESKDYFVRIFDINAKMNANLSAYYARSSRELVVTLVNSNTGAALKGASVAVMIGDKSYTVKIASSGQGRTAVDDLDYGTYAATLSYKGNANYNAVVTTENIAIKGEVSLFAEYDGITRDLIVTLVDANTGAALKGANVAVKIGDKSYTVKIASTGYGRLSLEELDYGSYNAELSYKGNAKHYAADASVDIVVKDNVALSVYEDSSTKELVVTLVDAVSGAPLKGASVVVYIDGVKYTVKINSVGEGRLSLADFDSGEYVVTANYKGNARYNAAEASVDIVVKDNVALSVYYDDITRDLIVTLVDAVSGAPLKGASVAVYIDGVKYTVKINSMGEGRLSLADFELGEYVVTANYKGNARYNAAEASVDIVVKDKAAISVYYDVDTEDLVVTLVDAVSGARLKGASVAVYIDGVKYTVKINSVGEGRLSLADFEHGTYNISVSYKGNAKYDAVSQTVDIVVKDAVSLSAVYDGTAKELTVTLVDANTGAALKGANVAVNIDGVKYSVKITSTGQGKLSLPDLIEGTHTAVVSYKGNANHSAKDISVDIAVTH